MQAAQAAPDRFGLLGLLSVIRMSDPDLTSIALGIDLTTLGLNLNSAENLYKTFGSPWLDEPTKGAPEFTVPQCYYAKQAPVLNVSWLLIFRGGKSGGSGADSKHFLENDWVSTITTKKILLQ